MDRAEEMRELIGKLTASAAKDTGTAGRLSRLRDALDLTKELEMCGSVTVLDRSQEGTKVHDTENFKAAHMLVKDVRREAARLLKESGQAGAEQVYKETLLFDAPYFVDEYCRYLEWNRPLQKKFYEPRRRVLKPLVDDLQDLMDRELDFLGISLPPRVGKELTDDTPVLTACGWKRHGDLVVGDEVYAPDGSLVKVTHVFPKEMADVRITFTDGEQIDAHENHEWLVYDRHKQKYRLAETKEFFCEAETGPDGQRGHRYMYLLPPLVPFDGEDKDLPVKPYSLGAWLGDGTNNTPMICDGQGDSAIFARVTADGYLIRSSFVHKTTGCLYVRFDDLREDLHKVEMCYAHRKTEKHIPEIYLTASKRQRLELLAGLLDTDGTLVRKERRYQFSTTCERLKEDFVSLVYTFGWRCSVKCDKPTVSSSGIKGNFPVWTVAFNPTEFIPCVLQRKQLREFSKQRRIAVKSVERIEPKPGNCISVEGGMYCAGKTMKPTHNSTLCIFFMSMLMGKRPDVANVMSGHSDKLTNGFFSEMRNILLDKETYLWNDVFPGVKVVEISAKNESIDLVRKKRFPTFTARSIGGTLTGAVEIGTGGCLYVDDLVEDLEESLNPERLANKYDAYLNQLKDRKKDGAFELMVGTRWNVLDPLGRIQEQYRDDPRYRFRVIPALNENGESNFNYPYNLGFSTAYYLDMKASIDDATWAAKYMGDPYVREGLLFARDKLRRFYELPAGEPDAIWAVCDPAQGGGDYTFLPVFYQYGNDHYLFDCVCSDALPKVTDEKCIQILLKHHVRQCQFENNAAGGRTADKVQQGVKERGGETRILKKHTQMNKETKIISNSPFIQDRILFLDDRYIQPRSDYETMMRLLCNYTIKGKNKHDDVPDGLSQYADFVISLVGNRVVLRDRRDF